MLRDRFPQYVRPSDDELAELLKNGIIALDSSALLNLYRYSKGTREDFLKVYRSRKIKPRLWLPSQVAAEFMKNRYTVLSEKHNEVDTLKQMIKSELETALKKVKSNIQNKTRFNTEHPHIDVDSLNAKLDQYISEVLDKVFKRFFKSPNQPAPGEELDDDPLYKSIEKLFGENIGNGFDQTTLEEIKRDGDLRFQRQVPPGYMDFSKKPDPYGDLVIWKELIEEAKSQGKGVILVIDDQKEDWVAKQERRRSGPRLELVKEMLDESGQQFHLYDSPRFLTYAKKLTDAPPRPQSVKEAENVNLYSDNFDFLKREIRTLTASANHVASVDMSSQFQPLDLVSDDIVGTLARTSFSKAIKDTFRSTEFWNAMAAQHQFMSELNLETRLPQYLGITGNEKLLQDLQRLTEAADTTLDPRKLREAMVPNSAIYPQADEESAEDDSD